jgi:hypothetical protein
MALAGTINPDFSQIEADVPQIEVNQRFPLFLCGTGNPGHQRSRSPCRYGSRAGPPCMPLRWLYERYHHWESMAVKIEVDPDAARHELQDPEALGRLERIVTLRQVGTAGGPCTLVAGLLLVWRWCTNSQPFDLVLAVTALLLGVVLVVFSWVRGVQQAQFLSRHGKRLGVRPEGALQGPPS